MAETPAPLAQLEARRRYNEEFLRRLYARRPGARAAHETRQRQLTVELAPRRAAPGGAAEGLVEEGMPGGAGPSFDQIQETIVKEERPVLFLQNDWINRTEVTLRGDEARELVDALDLQRDRFQPLMSLIGRVDVANFPGN